jgi:hypothetical protein
MNHKISFAIFLSLIICNISSAIENCYVKKAAVYGVWQHYVAECDPNDDGKADYEIKVRGPSVGFKYEEDVLMGITCNSDKPEGTYYGVRVGLVFAHGGNGGAFLRTRPEVSGCLIGELSSYVFEVNVGLPQLTITKLE